MNNDSPIYWKGPRERDGLPDPPADDPPAFGKPGVSRRQFLEAAGFTLSLAALGGCSRAPSETALPFAIQPEGLIPGRMRYYASTCQACPAACGLLVGTRDGRPLKMEGMPEHPLSRGGLCAVGQAMPLELYDSHRLQQPMSGTEQVNWIDVDKQIVTKCQKDVMRANTRPGCWAIWNHIENNQALSFM